MLPLPGTKFFWSAVVAGCGIMALLARRAAIHRFGTDQFTGNILFAVFFVLSIGLYCGFQSVIEDVFNRLSTLFRRPKVNPPYSPGIFNNKFNHVFT